MSASVASGGGAGGGSGGGGGGEGKRDKEKDPTDPLNGVKDALRALNQLDNLLLVGYEEGNAPAVTTAVYVRVGCACGFDACMDSLGWARRRGGMVHYHPSQFPFDVT